MHKSFHTLLTRRVFCESLSVRGGKGVEVMNCNFEITLGSRVYTHQRCQSVSLKKTCTPQRQIDTAATNATHSTYLSMPSHFSSSSLALTHSVCVGWSRVGPCVGAMAFDARECRHHLEILQCLVSALRLPLVLHLWSD